MSWPEVYEYSSNRVFRQFIRSCCKRWPKYLSIAVLLLDMLCVMRVPLSCEPSVRRLTERSQENGTLSDCGLSQSLLLFPSCHWCPEAPTHLGFMLSRYISISCRIHSLFVQVYWTPKVCAIASRRCWLSRLCHTYFRNLLQHFIQPYSFLYSREQSALICASHIVVCLIWRELIAVYDIGNIPLIWCIVALAGRMRANATRDMLPFSD